MQALSIREGKSRSKDGKDVICKKDEEQLKKEMMKRHKQKDVDDIPY